MALDVIQEMYLYMCLAVSVHVSCFTEWLGSLAPAFCKARYIYTNHASVCVSTRTSTASDRESEESERACERGLERQMQVVLAIHKDMHTKTCTQTTGCAHTAHAHTPQMHTHHRCTHTRDEDTPQMQVVHAMHTDSQAGR